jgi:serine phosphatase RsbU (regulator of sigma subunit)
LKPWNNRQLLEILRTQIEHGASRRRELQEKILAEVAKFTGGRFEDDATLVVVAVASEKSSG